ncbi:MAG: AAA family ATPase [Thermoguttaceae bacterium]
MNPPEPGLEPAAARCRQFFDDFRAVLAERLVLPARWIEQGLVALLSGGHLLLEGKPGIGKRTLADALARFSGMSFSALSCTAELEPLDLAGGEQLREDCETGRRRYEFVPGSLFANVVYVEHIHLAPPRSLAVLLEAMRGRQVGQGRNVQDLPSPFFLVASAAPGLDETDRAMDPSLTDRFVLQISFDYPSESDEWEIGRRAGTLAEADGAPRISCDELIELQRAAVQVELPDEVLGYAWALARATRPGNTLAPDFVEKWIRLGISPQGLVALVSAAKTRALLRGRTRATRRDVYELAQAVFQHRLGISEEARAAGLSVGRLVNMLLERVSLEGEYRPQRDP